MMYDELVKWLRDCGNDSVGCGGCPYNGRFMDGSCISGLLAEAADAIEELLDFAHYVASEVVVPDEEWENNIHYAFPEIVSRKLNKLGIVEKDGAFWHYEPPKEES